MLYNTFFLRLLGEEVLTFYPTIFFFSVPMEWMDQNREKIQQNSFLETHVVKIIDLKSEKS